MQQHWLSSFSEKNKTTCLFLLNFYSTLHYLVLVNNYNFQFKKNKQTRHKRQNDMQAEKEPDCMLICDGSGFVSEALVTASKPGGRLGEEKHLLESGVSWQLCGQTCRLDLQICSSDLSLCPKLSHHCLHPTFPRAFGKTCF